MELTVLDKHPKMESLVNCLVNLNQAANYFPMARALMTYRDEILDGPKHLRRASNGNLVGISAIATSSTTEDSRILLPDEMIEILSRHFDIVVGLTNNPFNLRLFFANVPRFRLFSNKSSVYPILIFKIGESGFYLSNVYCWSVSAGVYNEIPNISEYPRTVLS